MLMGVCAHVVGVAHWSSVPAGSLEEIPLVWGRIPCDQRAREGPGIEAGASPQPMRTGIRLAFHRRSKKKERIQRADPLLAPQKVRSGTASLVWGPLCMCVCGCVDVMCTHLWRCEAESMRHVCDGVWYIHR